jgi:hypothetical protein
MNGDTTVPGGRSGQPGIGEFVFYAEQRLALGAGNRVAGGHIGVRSAAGNPGGGQLTAGAGSVIEAGHSVLSPSVSLGHAVRRGAVLADAVAGPAESQADQPFPASLMPPLPLAASPAAGTETVSVPAGQERTLVPGRYGTLTVDGSLVLDPGDYVFASIDVGDGATLEPSGAARVVVLSYLRVGQDAEIQPPTGQPAGLLTISIAGTDQDQASPAVSVGERAQLRALLSAPHGSVVFADHAQVSGAVAGFAITTGDGVAAVFESGFPDQARLPAGSQQLTGAYGVPPGPGTDPVAGPVPAGTGISLSIGLPVRDNAGLQNFIASVSDPKSPQYRTYISQDEFTATYGATAADYAALQRWADAAGFTTIATFDNNLLLRVTGTAAQIQEVLFVNLLYRTRPDGSTFIATDRDLSLNLSVPVLEINGLGEALLPVAQSQNGTGAGGSYRAADLRNAYLGVGSPLQALDGSGQHVGVIGVAQFTGPDVTGYFKKQVSASGEISPLPAPDAAVVETENPPPFTPGTPAGFITEADVDVEMVYAMAPKATISFFKGTPGITDRLDGILHSMATFNPPLTIVSCSLQFGKSNNSQQALDQMATQGVSYFSTSGDSGDVGGSVPDSVKMNHQTVVGGTVLSTNPLGSSEGTVTYPVPYYASESAWPGSGGGVISDTGIPAFQVGIMQLNAAANGGSVTNRNYPDVAMLATDVEIFSGGSPSHGGAGTSLGAPLWAGFTALANQLSMQNGHGQMGFLNPTLYDIGLTINDSGGNDLYDLCFHDVQSGTNGGFKAVRGYDLVTGLGSPTGALITQLASAAPATPQSLSLIRFTIGTGGDNLRGDSTATATVLLKNGGQFTITLKPKNAGSWDNDTTHGPLDFAIPDTVTLPTASEGLSGVRINLIQGGSFPETADNWDITTLAVSLLSPGGQPVCQLNLTGKAKLQDSSTGLVRLSASAGTHGDGPTSPLFSTGPGSGC